MLTDFQKTNFEMNRDIYDVFKELFDSMKGNTNIELIIDFFNMSCNEKINIISNISNKYIKEMPVGLVKRIMLDILHMEPNDIANIFNSEDGIDLNKEIENIKNFIKELEKYEIHLKKYDFNILELYAKYVGIMV